MNVIAISLYLDFSNGILKRSLVVYASMPRFKNVLGLNFYGKYFNYVVQSGSLFSHSKVI